MTNPTVVETGLMEAAALVQPVQESVTETSPEPAPLVQVPALDTLATQELTGLGTKEFNRAYQEAEEENRKRDFVHAILAARVPDNVQPTAPTQPPIPAVSAQTKLEMEMGAAQVAKNAAEQVNRPRPKPQDNGTMVPVFRPDDYVPDIKKGQGVVASSSARPLM